MSAASRHPGTEKPTDAEATLLHPVRAWPGRTPEDGAAARASINHDREKTTMNSLHEIADTRGAAAGGWREPPTLTLDARGVIVDCSDSGEAYFGYSRNELARRHVSELLPQLGQWDLWMNGEPNPHFNFLCHIGHAFQVRSRHDRDLLSHLNLVCLGRAGETILRLIAQPAHG